MTLRNTLAALATSFLMMCMLGSTAHAQDDSRWLDLDLGKSVVLETPNNATAIAITDPTVADVVPLASANKLQIQGKRVGSTDLVVQLGPGTEPIIYEITVHRDLSEMVRRIDAVVDGSTPEVSPLADRLVIEGVVDDLDTLEKIAQIARVYDEKFVNLMTVRGDHQVQLEVVFAEVSRSGLRELGLNAMMGEASFLAVGIQGTSANTGVVVTHLGVAPVMNAGMVPGAAGSAFHLMAWIPNIGLGAVLSILDEYKLSKVLAQPSLVCLSGQEATFQSGGEVPIPAPGGMGAITVTFQEYGIILSFVPTVLANNVIDIRVDLEVSEIDFASGTRLTGVEIPGFRSRKGQSHLRLESGMTFAMAGLLSESMQFTRAQIPVLGQLPIVGTLFRYTRHEREETELMIFVTPRLVRPLGPGEVPAPPGTNEDNHPSDFELFLLGMDHRTGSRKGTGEASTTSGQPTGLVGMDR